MTPLMLMIILVSIPCGFVLGFVHYRYQPRSRGQSWIIGLIATAMLAIIGAFGIAIATHMSLRDVELISGQVTEKTREHGHYQRSYECMCTTDSKGNRTCQTCYEDRYTVKWEVKSTIGNFTIDSLDRGSKRVYNEPDPPFYLLATRGDPVAAEHYYQNYMKGVPKEYLYNDNMGALPELLKEIPEYPKTYNFYKVNRVLDISGVLPPLVTIEYNKKIAEALRTLGPEKEVNIILVIGKPDPQLVYAVREKWEGGKKNDVIVTVGIDENRVITNVGILTWDKNEYFKNKLEMNIRDHAVLNAEMLEIIFKDVQQNYTRPRMRDYQELREHVDTPVWAVFTVLIVMFGLTAIGAYVIYRN